MGLLGRGSVFPDFSPLPPVSESREVTLWPKIDAPIAFWHVILSAVISVLTVHTTGEEPVPESRR
jgi:hypothetical protein